MRENGQEAKQGQREEQIPEQARPRYTLDPALEKQARRLAARANELSGSLPTSTLTPGSPRLLKSFRLKRAALKEAQLGLIGADEEGKIRSPNLDVFLAESRVHASVSYDDWANLLTDIYKALQPYVGIIVTYINAKNKLNEKARKSAQAAYELDRPGYAGMDKTAVEAARKHYAAVAEKEAIASEGWPKSSSQEVAYAAYQIKASSLLGLYDEIVGNNGCYGLADTRADRIQNRLQAWQAQWLSWARVPTSNVKFPTIDVSSPSSMYAAFAATHPSALGSDKEAQEVALLLNGEYGLEDEPFEKEV